MIRYSLRCEHDHAFESWFQDSSAYDTQVKRKLVSCPVCGSHGIEKAIMAPRIVGKKGRESSAPAPAETGAAATSTPLLMAQERELRAKLRNCATTSSRTPTMSAKASNEARKMHYGEIEHRPIHGEAAPDEAQALIEEGVEVSPLPVLPDDRN
jgi:hypothetical protein